MEVAQHSYLEWEAGASSPMHMQESPLSVVGMEGVALFTSESHQG